MLKFFPFVEQAHLQYLFISSFVSVFDALQYCYSIACV